MEVRLVRGAKNGYTYEKIYLNGQEVSPCAASRLVTNTDSEDGVGIFHSSTRFRKGDVYQTFKFKPLGEFGSDEFIKDLQTRIKTVREWVKSLNCEHQIVFQVPDEP